MTDITRDEAICQLYREGCTLADIGQRYDLSKARVQQIIRAHGLTKADRAERPGDGREEFLGVHVTSDTKARLRRKAGKKSMSKIASKILEDGLRDN